MEKRQYGGNIEVIIIGEVYKESLSIAKGQITQPPTFIGSQIMIRRNVFPDLFIFIISASQTL
jgi:hypothetical protein